MLGVYYKIWVDCILRAQQDPANKKSWPLVTMLAMTMAMSANFVLLMTILEKFFIKKYFYKIDSHLIPTRMNNLISYIFLFILPCFIINYFLVFYRKRYNKLIKKYNFYKGRLFISYFVFSLLLPLIIIWVMILL